MKKRVSELREGDRLLAMRISYMKPQVDGVCLEDVRDYGDGSFAIRIELTSGHVVMREWDESEQDPFIEVVD